MSLTNPNTPVSQKDLQNFYHKLLPYIGSSDGHTIENSEGSILEQRDTLQFSDGLLVEDDNTNKKTIISPDTMQSGDINDIINPLPSVQQKYHKYSTEEQIVGEWIDGKPLYECVFTVSVGSGKKDDVLVYTFPTTIGTGWIVGAWNGATDTRINVANLAYSTHFHVRPTGIFVNQGASIGAATWKVIVQYTKTTD